MLPRSGLHKTESPLSPAMPLMSGLLASRKATVSAASRISCASRQAGWMRWD